MQTVPKKTRAVQLVAPSQQASYFWYEINWESVLCNDFEGTLLSS